jgi:hypothetical protein
MTTAAPAAPSNSVSAVSSSAKLLVGLTAFTAPFTQQRLGGLQPVELVLLSACGLLLLDLFKGKAVYSLHSSLRGSVFWFLSLLLIIASGSAIALMSVDFYPPDLDLSFLQTAPWLTISRLVQLTAMCFGFCVVANACIRDREILRFGLKVFIYTSLLISLYATLSYILQWAGIVHLPGITFENNLLRMRGTFIEGGPYGLYMLGVFVAIRLAHYLQVFSRWFSFCAGALVCSNIYFSVSKSAIIATLILIIIEIMLGKGRARFKIAIVLFSVLVAIPIAPMVYTSSKAYVATAMQLEEILVQRQEVLGRKRSYNIHLVSGRVATLVIAPKIIKDRPFFGIGLGNYPLVRNDPAYRGGLPAIAVWDLHAIGLVGYTTEIGIPAFIVLLLVLLRIPTRAVLGRVPGPLICAAVFQPVACMVGAQITFFYPWLLSSFVFSLLYHYQQDQKGARVMSSQLPTSLSTQVVYQEETPVEPPAKSIIISELFYVLLRKWWLIGLVTMVCVIGGLFFLRVQGVSYTAEMRVAELENDTSGSVRNVLTTLPFNLGGKGGGKLDYYLAMLTDPLLVDRLQDKSRLLAILYPHEWNEQTHSWNQPSWSFIGWIRAGLKEFIGVPVWVAPNSAQIADKIEETIMLSPDAATGYWTVSATMKKKEDALELLQILHKEADLIVRERDQDLAESRIAYIRDKLQTVQVSEHRSNLTQFLMAEEQKIILSSSGADYAAMLLSPPSASDLPTSPKISLSIAIFIALGILFGSALSLLIDPKWRRIL